WACRSSPPASSWARHTSTRTSPDKQRTAGVCGRDRPQTPARPRGGDVSAVTHSRTSRALTLIPAMPPPRSAALLEVDVIRTRFAAGDERSLEECQRRFGPLLLANARRIVGPNDAEDVVQ